MIVMPHEVSTALASLLRLALPSKGKENPVKSSALTATMALFHCTLALTQALHAADTWPNKPLRFITPAQPGTSADVAARALARQLTAIWKQPVVVDNRPGGGTIVASQALAAAPADGYSFAWVLTAHATNPSLYRKLPYDTVKDFSGVTLLYSLRMLITAAPSLPANSVSELIALAKSKPGELTVTSPLPGSIPHLLAEIFKRKEGLQMEHINYKGTAGAHNDVMGGRVSVMFDTLPGALPQLRAGRLKALAMIGDTPAKELPGVPVLAGLVPPNSRGGWNGIVVPSRTPKDMVKKLNADLIAAVRSREIQERFANLTVDTITNTPQEFDVFIKSEIAFWGEVVRNAGIKLD